MAVRSGYGGKNRKLRAYIFKQETGKASGNEVGLLLSSYKTQLHIFSSMLQYSHST